MHSITVYEMHIFKDVENTSWTSPKITTFQITEHSARSVIRSNGSKGGLSNLRRCSPEQLEFLQSHLAGRNAILKSEREEEEKAAQKKREARKKKNDAKIQAAKAARDLRKSQEQNRQKDHEDQAPKEESVHQTQPPYSCGGIPPPPPPPHFYYNSVDRTTPLYAPPSRYGYPPPPQSPPPPPPPPPPFIHSHSPPICIHPRRSERLTRLQQESDWSLESIDLDLIPIVAKVEAKKLKISPSAAENSRDNNYDHDRRRMRMPRLAYKLADLAKVEFAVLYSRTAMTNVPYARHGMDPGRVYVSHRSDEEESFLEYGSEEDIREIIDEESEDEDNEEEDLEIVEGFGHGHPITESMAGCMEKES